MRYLIILITILSFGCKSKRETTVSETRKENKKKIVTSVLITGMTISNFPKYGKDGEAWDAYAPFATNPDLFVTIDWNGNLLYKSEVHNECEIGTAIVLSKDFPLIVKPFDQPLTLEVFDEDGISSNDNVGYFSLKLMDYKGQRTFTVRNETVSIDFTADWVYE